MLLPPPGHMPHLMGNQSANRVEFVCRILWPVSDSVASSKGC